MNDWAVGLSKIFKISSHYLLIASELVLIAPS